MSVRQADCADIPQLLPLIERYWEFEGIVGFAAPRIEALLRELLASTSAGAVFVADTRGVKVPDSLAGYLIVVLYMSFEHQGIMGEIDELFVLPEARSQSLGGQLLEAAEGYLLRRGAVRLQLQIGAGKARTRAFYERHGFTARSGYALFDKPLLQKPSR